MDPILNIVVKSSKTRQTSDLDLCEAVEKLENVASALVKMRNDDTVFEENYKQTEELCSGMDRLIHTFAKKNKGICPFKRCCCNSRKCMII